MTNTTLTGRIRVTGKGLGFFPLPNNPKESYEVQPELNASALNGDEVKIEVLGHEVYGRKQAKVIEIVSRHKTEFVGTLESTDGGFFLVPDDKKMYRDIFIPADKSMDGTAGDKVQTKITEWTDPLKSPKGEVVRVIGKKGDHNAEMESLVYDAGFEIGFPQDVEREANDWIKKYAEEDHTKDRRDYKEAATFTIDPADAKDFDDALSIKTLDGGTFEIGIHIADVSHFVVPGTALDAEAKKRGTSIYLVDRTIPMLPEVLSNNLCSLNAHEDKYAFSAIFTMNMNGDVLDRWFGKTLIESDRRFVYEDAQDILDAKQGEFFEELNTLNKIAYKLREQKFKNGAIEFETEEVKFQLDATGKPVKIFRKVRKDIHKLVEDFMLLANREVAMQLAEATKINPKAAGVYRIHNAPDRERIINLAAFVKALGFELKNKEGETTAEDISEMLKSVEGTPAEMLIKTAAIRSMSKAIYSTGNIGHFGLAFDYYTHFTSPIRRYPDLMVHRLLYRFLTHGKIEADEVARYERLCVESSEREVEAAEAERGSIRYKQIEYMLDKVGQIFDGTISGVSEWGVYIEEAESKAEGMARLKEMTDDFYSIDEKNYAIVGQKTGKRYSLGDKVKVKLIAADPERKNLDFQIVQQ